MSFREDTINLSKLYGVKPSRNRGQNFLIEEKIYKDIIEAASLSKEETVLEVGPGLGFLTLLLSSEAKEVIAVELDKKLFLALGNRLEIEKINNVQLFNSDVMNLTSDWVKEIKKVDNNKLVVVANLPYTITSIFLRNFVGGNKENILPQRFVLMLQKEVAQRLVAKKGDLSVLALSVQIYCEAKIIELVSKKYFWPSPEVDSAVISLERTDKWLNELKKIGHSDKELLRLIKIGFSARRKMLKANLSNGFCQDTSLIVEAIKSAGLSEKVRAQDLDLSDWLKLLSLIS